MLEETIFVVSDGTGGTAEQAIKAALTQFEEVEVEFIRRPEVRTEAQVRQVVEEAARTGALIVHTLVSETLRETMLRLGREHNVETIDIMGPLLSRLSHRFATAPTGKPGMFQQINKDYFRRIEAIEFAIRHDDGQRVQEIDRAEIVLIGVSRTFKTPLSIYLAYKGWFVANVPIVLGVQPPAILFELPPEKVFCLDTNPRQLAQLRQARQEFFGDALMEYASFEYVQLELMHARDIFHRQPRWTIINVTGKSIEEIAHEILLIKKQNG
ncbi:MAG: kinase/pyrophosphorylase [Calditrichaeota bacterium]|nr:MAG: kinase/pyrophosphorylase [Calditrichota bacterium]